MAALAECRVQVGSRRLLQSCMDVPCTVDSLYLSSFLNKYFLRIFEQKRCALQFSRENSETILTGSFIDAIDVITLSIGSCCRIVQPVDD